jgi:hypothetical protein
MRRGLWFVAGAGSAVYVMVRGRRAAEVFTVDGLKDRVGALEVGARIFRDEVAQGQADKESELRERLGLLPHGTPELTGGRHQAPPTTENTSTTDHSPTTGSGQEGSN